MSKNIKKTCTCPVNDTGVNYMKVKFTEKGIANFARGLVDITTDKWLDAMEDMDTCEIHLPLSENSTITLTYLEGEPHTIDGIPLSLADYLIGSVSAGKDINGNFGLGRIAGRHDNRVGCIDLDMAILYGDKLHELREALFSKFHPTATVPSTRMGRMRFYGICKKFRDVDMGEMIPVYVVRCELNDDLSYSIDFEPSQEYAQ